MKYHAWLICYRFLTDRYSSLGAGHRTLYTSGRLSTTDIFEFEKTLAENEGWSKVAVTNIIEVEPDEYAPPDECGEETET